MKKITTRQIALNGIVAGLYAGLTILIAPLSYGNIQCRISEALCLLVCIEPSLTVGLTLGCLIANLFSTVSVLDIFIGTSATLIGCLLTIHIRKAWLAPLPTILSNGILVGAMLAWVYGGEAVFWKSFVIFGAEVAAGEAVALYVLGIPLLLTMRKTKFIERFTK